MERELLFILPMKPSEFFPPLRLFPAILLLLACPLGSTRSQDIYPLAIQAKTTWDLPKKKVTSLTEFFSLLPEMEIHGVGKRMLMAKVVSAQVAAKGDATIRFQFVQEEFPMFLPSRAGTVLEIPLRGMGNPFVAGQTWSLFFNKDGELVRLQHDSIMTHYRKRKGGLVEVRVHDGKGHGAQFVPTTVMPPEAEFEDGFFGYIDIFREAGMVAGGDAVGGPGVLELESIVLPDAEPILVNGLEPDTAPWIEIRAGGMGAAIPASQRYAY